MAEKKLAPRVEPVKLDGFHLLNPAKVQRALDQLGESPSANEVLALYDKFGGAIKKDSRLLKMGSFYDFAERKAKRNVKLVENDYQDHLVLVRKPKTKRAEGPSLRTRLAQVKQAEADTTEEDESEEVEAPKVEAPKPKRGRKSKKS